jgi:hypothetical protein
MSYSFLVSPVDWHGVRLALVIAGCARATSQCNNEQQTEPDGLFDQVGQCTLGLLKN